MVRLLDACVQTLSQQGKRRMYIDAVKWGDAGFQSMGSLNSIISSCCIFQFSRNADALLVGFHKWARYREIWRDV